MNEQLSQLVREGLPLLHFIARGIARRVGEDVPLDDLIAYGHPALLEVARTFEPGRCKFSTYTALKVKWAILDGLRRETRARPAWLAARIAAATLAERFIDDASATEMEAGIPVTEEACKARLRALLDGQAAALAVGLTRGSSSAREDSTREDTLDRIPDSVDTPEESASRSELRRDIRSAVSALVDPRERALVERHYFGGEPFDEIAKDLGVSKSWASRLHAGAMAKLAEALRAMDPNRPDE